MTSSAWRVLLALGLLGGGMVLPAHQLAELSSDPVLGQNSCSEKIARQLFSRHYSGRGFKLTQLDPQRQSISLERQIKLDSAEALGRETRTLKYEYVSGRGCSLFEETTGLEASGFSLIKNSQGSGRLTAYGQEVYHTQIISTGGYYLNFPNTLWFDRTLPAWTLPAGFAQQDDWVKRENWGEISRLKFWPYESVWQPAGREFKFMAGKVLITQNNQTLVVNLIRLNKSFQVDLESSLQLVSGDSWNQYQHFARGLTSSWTVDWRGDFELRRALLRGRLELPWLETKVVEKHRQTKPWVEPNRPNLELSDEEKRRFQAGVGGDSPPSDPENSP